MVHRMRLSSLFLAIAAVALLTGLPDVFADNLVTNGRLNDDDKGWTNQLAGMQGVDSTWVKDGGRDGSGAIHILARDVNEQTPLIWRFPLASAAAGKRVKFSGWARGKGCQGEPLICVQAWDKGRKNIIGFGTTQGKQHVSGDFDWTRLESEIHVPQKTETLHLLAFLMGKGEVWFDEISAEVAGDADAAVLASELSRDVTGAPPGLFLARGEYEIKGVQAGLADWLDGLKKSSQSRAADGKGPGKKDAGEKKADAPKTIKLLMPVPLSYREQQPLTYEIAVEPPEDLKSARVYEDKPGNYVAEVELIHPGNRAQRLSWKSLVLVGSRSFDDVPKTAAMPAEWPAEARPWLKATRYANSDDEKIRALANEIRGPSTDVVQIIHATITRTQAIFSGQQGRCAELGAVEALTKQGSCTSCANLVAALLRASGIPARILAGYPTWSGPLQTHYIVEAWIPGYGWYPIESTMLKAPLSPAAQVQVSIVPIEYEGEMAKPRPFVAGGVPYLSLTESVDHDGTWTSQGVIPGAQYCDHVAGAVKRFDTADSASDLATVVDRAKARWQQWLRSAPRAKDGRQLSTDLAATDLSDENTPTGLLDRLSQSNR